MDNADDGELGLAGAGDFPASPLRGAGSTLQHAPPPDVYREDELTAAPEDAADDGTGDEEGDGGGIGAVDAGVALINTPQGEGAAQGGEGTPLVKRPRGRPRGSGKARGDRSKLRGRPRSEAGAAVAAALAAALAGYSPGAVDLASRPVPPAPATRPASSPTSSPWGPGPSTGGTHRIMPCPDTPLVLEWNRIPRADARMWRNLDATYFPRLAAPPASAPLPVAGQDAPGSPASVFGGLPDAKRRRRSMHYHYGAAAESEEEEAPGAAAEAWDTAAVPAPTLPAEAGPALTSVANLLRSSIASSRVVSTLATGGGPFVLSAAPASAAAAAVAPTEEVHPVEASTPSVEEGTGAGAIARGGKDPRATRSGTVATSAVLECIAAALGLLEEALPEGVTDWADVPAEVRFAGLGPEDPRLSESVEASLARIAAELEGVSSANAGKLTTVLRRGSTEVQLAALEGSLFGPSNRTIAAGTTAHATWLAWMARGVKRAGGGGPPKVGSLLARGEDSWTDSSVVTGHTGRGHTFGERTLMNAYWALSGPRCDLAFSTLMNKHRAPGSTWRWGAESDEHLNVTGMEFVERIAVSRAAFAAALVEAGAAADRAPFIVELPGLEHLSRNRPAPVEAKAEVEEVQEEAAPAPAPHAQEDVAMSSEGAGSATADAGSDRGEAAVQGVGEEGEHSGEEEGGEEEDDGMTGADPNGDATPGSGATRGRGRGRGRRGRWPDNPWKPRRARGRPRGRGRAGRPRTEGGELGLGLPEGEPGEGGPRPPPPPGDESEEDEYLDRQHTPTWILQHTGKVKPAVAMPTEEGAESSDDEAKRLGNAAHRVKPVVISRSKPILVTLDSHFMFWDGGRVAVSAPPTSARESRESREVEGEEGEEGSDHDGRDEGRGGKSGKRPRPKKAVKTGAEGGLQGRRAAVMESAVRLSSLVEAAAAAAGKGDPIPLLRVPTLPTDDSPGAPAVHLDIEGPSESRVAIQLSLPPMPLPVGAAASSAVEAEVNECRRFFHYVLGKPSKADGHGAGWSEAPGSVPPSDVYPPRTLLEYGHELRLFGEAAPLGILVTVGLKPRTAGDELALDAGGVLTSQHLAWTLGRITGEWRNAGVQRRFLRVALLVPGQEGVVESAWIPVADARVVPYGLF